jgi:hypothetical protein
LRFDQLFPLDLENLLILLVTTKLVYKAKVTILSHSLFVSGTRHPSCFEEPTPSSAAPLPNKLDILLSIPILWYNKAMENKKAAWRPSKRKIYGFDCVEYAVPECPATETCLSGKNGEIWECAPGMLKAYVSGRISPFLKGKGSLETFPAEDLALWVKAMKIYKTMTKQAHFANNGMRR